MSHFLDRLTFFKRIEGRVRRRSRHHHQRGPALGGRLPQALAARQDRALHARRQLHRLVLVEDLRQGRHRHLGDAADRLPAHAARLAEPRAARLLARRQLQLVPLFRQPREVSAGALAPAQAVARGARAADAGRGLGLDRREPGEARGLHQKARPRRLRARDLGRGHRDHRRRQRLHRQDLRPRPRHRLLADPGHVDGQLRRRLALSVAARRRVHVVLRLVLRPAAGFARRPGASRPTCRNRPTGTTRAS